MNNRKPDPVLVIAKRVALGVAGGIVLGTILGSFYTVDQGERAVVLRNGAITGVADAGLNWKAPFIDKAVTIDVRSQAFLYENIMAYSKDQQTAGLTVSVNWRVPADQVADVYEDYGSEAALRARLLDRQVYDEVKNVFGRFNAVTAIQERGRLVAEVQSAIQDSVQGPILIESVQIENIDFDDSYEQAIAARMEAEVEVQKVWQNAEREKASAMITITKAQAAADSQLAIARAEAEAIRVKGDAEASAIRARGEALRDNPDLVSLVAAQQWNGVLPTTMVPNGAVPFVSVGK